MSDVLTDTVASVEHAFQQRPSMEPLVQVTVVRALKKALSEYSAANVRNNTPLRVEQYAVLQDFLNTKGTNIAEAVAIPLVQALKK